MIETIGEFEFDRNKLIGKGSWGEVYLGWQRSLNRPVAIKFLKPELTSDPEFVKRFTREAETLAKVVDEHILQVYSAGVYQGSYYFIMEFVHGQPLSKFIERGRKFTPAEIIYVAESVAQALKTAWESPAKIVHRDIKPSNIMISYSSSWLAPKIQLRPDVSESVAVMDINLLETKIKVMDFGLAKVATGDKEATMVGTVIGTPKYLSPEQGMGQPADIRSDIYSLGIVMYEMATGRIPFEGESVLSLIRRHIYDTPAPVSQYNPEIPPGLEAIIMKCIQKDPNKRYADPNQLLEDISAFKQKHFPIHASKSDLETTLVTAYIQKKQRQVKYLYVIFAAVVILISLGIYLFMFMKVSQKPVQSNDMSQMVKEGLIQLDDLIVQDKLLEAWQKLAEIDIKYEDHEEVKIRRKNLINKWAEKIQALIKDDQLEEAEAQFHQLPFVLQESDRFQEIKAELVEKLDKKIRSQLAAKFLQENPTKFELKEKAYSIKFQKDFNSLLDYLNSKKYSAVYRSLDNDFINLKDEELSPPALYFKMKVLLQEKPQDYPAKMKEVLEELQIQYPAHPVVSLAQALLEEAKQIADDELYHNYLLARSGKSLEEQLRLLEEFRQNYPENRHLPNIEVAINEIKTKIFDECLKACQNLINCIPELDKTGYLKAAQKLAEAFQWAEKFSQDTKLLIELQNKLELGWLAFYGIIPLDDERVDGLFRFIKSKSDNAEMILIPKGEFLMGAFGGDENEQPEHMVMLNEYYIDKYEVTNAQFEIFVNHTGYVTDAEKAGRGWVWRDGELKEVKGACWRDPEGDGRGIKDRMDHPVVQVSWNDACAYAKWAGKRLPTEAEWEKAARGTDARIYPWGNQWQDLASNNILTGPGRTVSVKQYPNGRSFYGIYQMVGNVAEWCYDFYLSDYYKHSPKENPQGPATGECHTLRGGSFIHHKKYLRTTARLAGKLGNQTNFWSNYIGFRCVKDIDKEIYQLLNIKNKK